MLWWEIESVEQSWPLYLQVLCRKLFYSCKTIEPKKGLHIRASVWLEC